MCLGLPQSPSFCPRYHRALLFYWGGDPTDCLCTRRKPRGGQRFTYGRLLSVMLRRALFLFRPPQVRAWIVVAPPPFPRRGMRSLFLRPIYCIFAFNFCGLFPTITLIHNTCRTCGEILFASQFCEWVAGSYIVGHLLNNMVLLRLYSLENGDNER